MKAKIFALLLMLSVLPLNGAVTAADEVENLLGQGDIITISNSYFAMYQNLYPEEATRIGLDAPNNNIDMRDAEADESRAFALNKIKKDIASLPYRKMSIFNKIDYEILNRRLAYDLKELSKNKKATSAFYYAQALDSVYDVMLKRQPYRTMQVEEIEGRLLRMPDNFALARAQLKTLTPSDVQLAKDKIYNAYINTWDVENFSVTAVGEQELSVVSLILKNNKIAMRGFFDFLTSQVKDDIKKDYALGSTNYTFLLQNKFYIDTPTGKIAKTLTDDIKAARENLLISMQPAAKQFMAKLLAADAAAPQPAPKSKKAKKAAKKQERVLKVADFALLRKEYEDTPVYSELLSEISNTVQLANAKMKGFLPEAQTKVNINHMPKYEMAYYPSVLYVPPYGIENKLTGNLFVALPEYTNKEAIDKQLKKYFTYPQIKLIAAKEVVPGKQIFYAYSSETSAVRRALGDDNLVNGWALYAGDLAAEAGFLDTEQDKMFLAWERYVAAVKAYVDIRFHRKDISYEEAKLLLISFDIPQEDVDAYIKDIILNPARHLSAYLSYNEITRLRAKYQRQLGAKFTPAGYHLKLFATGKVPIGMLEEEMDARYKRDTASTKSEIAADI